MQFYHNMRDLAYFAGETPSDGYISIDFGSPYLGYTTFMIDSDKGLKSPLPYTDRDNRVDIISMRPTADGRAWANGAWQPIVILTDHPHSRIPTHFTNSKTLSENCLFRRVSQYRIVTVLVAVNQNIENQNAYQIQPLCWVEWGAIHEAAVHWRKDSSGTPWPDAPALSVISRFYMTEQYKASSLYDDVNALIKNPPSTYDHTFNTMYKTMLDAVATRRGDTERFQSLPTWHSASVPLPADHFK